MSRIFWLFLDMIFRMLLMCKISWGGGGEMFKILKFSFLSLSFFFLLSCFAPVLTFSVFSSNSMAYDPRQNSLFHHLNFYLNFIAEYKILHSFFRFRIIGKRFYTRLIFFKLNSVIWPCSPYIFNSLHQITLAESYFKLDLENFQHDFWIFVHASVIVDQDHLSVGGSWLAL